MKIRMKLLDAKLKDYFCKDRKASSVNETNEDAID